MSEAKFTKEEWEVVDGTKVGTGVLFVHAPSISGVICRLTHYGNPEIPISEADKANAHLIAAAPDMYKDIEEGIEWLERLAKKCVIGSYELRGIQSRIERKVALLAKARGEV